MTSYVGTISAVIRADPEDSVLSHFSNQNPFLTFSLKKLSKSQGRLWLPRAEKPVFGPVGLLLAFSIYLTDEAGTGRVFVTETIYRSVSDFGFCSVWTRSDRKTFWDQDWGQQSWPRSEGASERLHKETGEERLLLQSSFYPETQTWLLIQNSQLWLFTCSCGILWVLVTVFSSV